MIQRISYLMFVVLITIIMIIYSPFQVSLVRLWSFWCAHWVHFIFFSENWCSCPPCHCSVSAACLIGILPCFLETRQCHPKSKGLPYSSGDNYQPISITSAWSEVFERLVWVQPGWFMERHGVLPTTQCAYRKSPGTYDAGTLKTALESGQEARIMRFLLTQPFIGLTIREFSVGSALLVL